MRCRNKVIFDSGVWTSIAVNPNGVAHRIYQLLHDRGFTICIPLCDYLAIYNGISERMGVEAAMDFCQCATFSAAIRSLPFGKHELALIEELETEFPCRAAVVATAVVHECVQIVSMRSTNYPGRLPGLEVVGLDAAVDSARNLGLEIGSILNRQFSQ